MVADTERVYRSERFRDSSQRHQVWNSNEWYKANREGNVPDIMDLMVYADSPSTSITYARLPSGTEFREEEQIINHRDYGVMYNIRTFHGPNMIREVRAVLPGK